VCWNPVQEVEGKESVYIGYGHFSGTLMIFRVNYIGKVAKTVARRRGEI
jgi:hypothetical protein